MDSSVDGILFDLDGTLIDSISLFMASLAHACHTHLGYAPPQEWIDRLMGRPLRDTLEELMPDAAEDLYHLFVAHEVERHDELVRPYPEIIDVVRELQARAIPLGIVTSKPRGLAMRALELHNLMQLFTAVVGLEDTERHKPDPAPLVEGARRLGLAPTSLIYVGDTIHDLHAAEAAGMRGVGVLWGAGREEELRQAPSLALVMKPYDLVTLIDEKTEL